MAAPGDSPCHRWVESATQILTSRDTTHRREAIQNMLDHNYMPICDTQCDDRKELSSRYESCVCVYNCDHECVCDYEMCQCQQKESKSDLCDNGYDVEENQYMCCSRSEMPCAPSVYFCDQSESICCHNVRKESCDLCVFNVVHVSRMNDSSRRLNPKDKWMLNICDFIIAQDTVSEITRQYDVPEVTHQYTCDTETESMCESSNIRHSSDNDMLMDYDTFSQLKKYKSDHDKGLMIAYININSLTRVFGELKTVMTDGLADILSVGESKLDSSIYDRLIRVENYKMYRRDVKRTAHGLIIYIRSNITHFRRMDLEYDDSETQFITLEVWLKKEKWFIVSVYKPPPAKEACFIRELSMLCELLYKESENILIMGDMNIDMKTDRNKLQDVCDQYDLKNVITGTTCFKSRTNPSLIDVILVSKPKRYHKSTHFDTGLSDFHEMICICTKVHAPQCVPRNIVYRSFKNFNEKDYVNDVSMIPFHVSYVFDDTDDVVWFHDKLLYDVVESHAPLKRRRLKKESVPYMNSELRKVQNRRNQLRNSYWNNKTDFNWEQYRKMRNKANVTNRKSEKRFLKEKCINAKNPKDFWQCFTPYLSGKSKTSDNIILKENGEIVSKPVEVCEVFKKHL